MSLSHMKPARLLAGAALSLAALVGACDSSTSPRSGELTLLLTDAPGDILSAVVTIEQVYLQPAEEGDAGRIIVLEEPLTTDLVTLADQVQLMVDAIDIPAGEYRQLRFVISGGYIEVEGDGGTTEIFASSPDYAGLPIGVPIAGSLQMPSFAQSGLKVTLPDDAIVIGDDESVTLVVDFDVEQSFGHAAGNSGKWVMQPVITAARQQ